MDDDFGADGLIYRGSFSSRRQPASFARRASSAQQSC